MLVSYDGTAYSGWQLQSQAQARTIQGQIERALTTVLREDRETICVCAAGRTDAGVHAVGQVSEAYDLLMASRGACCGDERFRDCMQWGSRERCGAYLWATCSGADGGGYDNT
jgi:hypothetical protein